MQSSSRRIEKIIRVIADKEDVQNYKIVQSYCGKKCDGYLGRIEAMQLVGSNKTLDIVIKLSEGSCEAFPMHEIYCNEIIFYEKILPAFVQLNKEHNIADPFNNAIKFYGAVKEEDEECIVMENMKVHNYEMWDRKQPMDNAHLELAMKMLAKLHGTSFALKAFKPETYHELVCKLMPDELIDAVFEKLMVNKQFRYLAMEAAGLFDKRTEYLYWKKMTDFADIIGDLLKQVMKHRSETYIVIQHGDFWCNNIMFLYEDFNDHSRPICIKLYDYQFCKQGTPAMDLSTLFYSSATSEMMANEQHYLKLYYNALTRHLAQFNLNADSIYSFDDLIKDWSLFSRAGFILSFLFKKLMLTNTEDAREINTESANTIVLRETNHKLYNQQMRDLIKHCVDCKYI